MANEDADEACDARSDVDTPVTFKPQLHLLYFIDEFSGAEEFYVKLLRSRSTLQAASPLVQESVNVVAGMVKDSRHCRAISRQISRVATLALDFYVKAASPLDSPTGAPRLDVGTIHAAALRLLLKLVSTLEEAVQDFVRCSIAQRHPRRHELQSGIHFGVRNFTWQLKLAKRTFGFQSKIRNLASRPPQNPLVDRSLSSVVWDTTGDVWEDFTAEEAVPVTPIDHIFYEPLLWFLRNIKWQSRVDPAFEKLEEGQFRDDLAAVTSAFSPRIERELAESRLDFTTAGAVQEWRMTAFERLFSMGDERPHERRANEDPGGEVWLLLMLLSLVAMEKKAGAIAIAEVFTIRFRANNATEPSTETRLDMCNAFAAFSLILCFGERHAEGVNAIEHAIEQLQPLYNEDPTRHRLVMARLRVAYAMALSSFARDAHRRGMDVANNRKATRVSRAAVAMLREARSLRPDDTAVQAALAHGLLVQVTVEDQRLSSVSFPRFYHKSCIEKRRAAKMEGPPEDRYILDLMCDHRNDDEYFAYYHDRLYKNDLGAYDGLLPVVEEAVSLLQELASGPTLHRYRPLLAKALLLNASFYDLMPGSGRGPGVALRARAVFADLNSDFGIMYESEYGTCCVRAAMQLAASSRQEEAVEAFKLALGLEYIDPQSTTLLFRGFRDQEALRCALALVLCRLERYEEAFVHVQYASKMAARRTYREELLLGEIQALDGLSMWLSDYSRLALYSLEEGVRTIKKAYRTEDIAEGSYVLALAWLGGVQCANGQAQTAVATCREALRLVQVVYDRQAERRLQGFTKFGTFEVTERLAPEAHLFLAAALTGAGETAEAHVHVKRSLDLSRNVPVADSIKKTALLLNAHLLEVGGDAEAAARLRGKAADLVKVKGFLAQLKCF